MLKNTVLNPNVSKIHILLFLEKLSFVEVWFFLHPLSRVLPVSLIYWDIIFKVLPCTSSSVDFSSCLKGILPAFWDQIYVTSSSKDCLRRRPLALFVAWKFIDHHTLDQKKMKPSGYHDTGQGFTQVLEGTRVHLTVVAAQ